MRVGLIGAGRRGTAWARAVQDAADGVPGLALAGIADADPAAAASLARETGAHAFASTLDLLDAVDLALVAVPVRDRALVASEALRRGAHAFVLWPPAASVPEMEALGKLAEEAGRELAVAHALPIAPLLGLSADRPLALALLDVELPLAASSAPPASGDPIPGDPAPSDLASGDPAWTEAPWPRVLAAACGLFGALARSPIRHVDAEAARDGARRLHALAAGFRFRSGFYAHLALGRTETPRVRLRIAGPEGVQERGLLGLGPAARALEIRRVVEAVRAGRAAPHGPLEAADTLRLTERVLRRIA